MEQTPFGYWRDTIPLPTAQTELVGRISTDVVIVGGGFTGLWTALLAKAAGADVVVIEAGRCGSGASSRNGGFCSPAWEYLECLDTAFGEDGFRVASAIDASWHRLREWATEFDVGWHDSTVYALPTTPGQQSAADRSVEIAGLHDVAPITHARTADAPVGPWLAGGSQTQLGLLNPAALVDRLRMACLVRGVRIYEHSRIRHINPHTDAVYVNTDVGLVKAHKLVMAAGSANRLLPGLAQTGYLTASYVTISHADAERLDEGLWSETTAVTDLRDTVSYVRRVDDRLLFGYGPGVSAIGVRPQMVIGKERWAQQAIDRKAALFPDSPAVSRWWSGPIDMSYDNLPTIGQHSERVWYAHGYSGNGIGTSRFAAEWLARQVTDGSHDDDGLPLWNRALARQRIPADYLDGLTKAQCLLARTAERAAERRWRRADST